METEPSFWERHIRAEDAAQAIAEYTVAIAAGQSHASTYRMIDSKGDIIWMHGVVSAISRHGTPILMRGVEHLCWQLRAICEDVV
jgi:hypothetical protein